MDKVKTFFVSPLFFGNLFHYPLTIDLRKAKSPFTYLLVHNQFYKIVKTTQYSKIKIVGTKKTTTQGMFSFLQSVSTNYQKSLYKSQQL